jgi:PTH1 family peptidyl-tRNA hydrolase
MIRIPQILIQKPLKAAFINFNLNRSRTLQIQYMNMGQKMSFIRGGRSQATQIDRPSTDDPDLWLLVGLGNPGLKYEFNRHNIGFMVIDALAKRENIDVKRIQENAAVGRGRLFDKKILLAKPMTFMNVSGESVGKLSRFYRIPSQRILVIYDDLDTTSGKVKLRQSGGHGGHNGMRSISAHLSNTKDFPRLKIGIGRPPEGMAVSRYVLQDFSRDEMEMEGGGMERAIEEAIQMIRAVLGIGMEKAVSGVRVDGEGKQIGRDPQKSVGGGIKKKKSKGTLIKPTTEDGDGCAPPIAEQHDGGGGKAEATTTAP